jgi:hypothetical protein
MLASPRQLRVFFSFFSFFSSDFETFPLINRNSSEGDSILTRLLEEKTVGDFALISYRDPRSNFIFIISDTRAPAGIQFVEMKNSANIYMAQQS